jgi:hypothetical protein
MLPDRAVAEGKTVVEVYRLSPDSANTRSEDGAVPVTTIRCLPALGIHVVTAPEQHPEESYLRLRGQGRHGLSDERLWLVRARVLYLELIAEPPILVLEPA